LVGRQAVPCAQVLHAPLEQTRSWPHTVPLGCGVPVAAHTDWPVEQAVVPTTQGLLVGTQVCPEMQGWQAPPRQYWLLPQFSGWWQQGLAFSAGLGLLALATGLYIGAHFGPGPRDGLMTGLHARLGWPIWAARTGVEGSVLLTGWWLGGTVGLGTLAFALLIGPLVARTLPWCETRLPLAQAATA